EIASGVQVHAELPVGKRVRSGDVSADVIALYKVACCSSHELDTANRVPGDDVAGLRPCPADRVVRRIKSMNAEDSISLGGHTAAVCTKEVALNRVTAVFKQLNCMFAEAVDHQPLHGAVTSGNG